MKNIFLITLSVIILTACKVSYSFRGGEIPGETFSVESFTNAASIVNPDLVIVLQDELQQRFTNESNLKYSDSEGDAHFEGMITNYSITPVQGTGDETVALNRLTISFKVTYTNKVNGGQDFDKTFTNYEDFEAAEDFSSVEQELIKKISQNLVDLVYNQVLVDW